MKTKKDIDAKTISSNDPVKINDSEIVNLLKSTFSKDERRKIVTKFLIEEIVGKDFVVGELCIKNTKRDTIHLAHNEHLDTSIALTQFRDLLQKSTFFSEQKVDFYKKPNSPNDYYWYFRVAVIIDNVEYKYILNIGRNKTDKHICFYAITNDTKKSADSCRISSAGNIRSF